MNIICHFSELKTHRTGLYSAIAIFVILSNLNFLAGDNVPVCGAVCPASGHYHAGVLSAPANVLNASVPKNKRVIRGRYRKRLNHHLPDNQEFSLWIDEQQVKLFSGNED